MSLFRYLKTIERERDREGERGVRDKQTKRETERETLTLGMAVYAFNPSTRDAEAD